MTSGWNRSRAGAVYGVLTRVEPPASRNRREIVWKHRAGRPNRSVHPGRAGPRDIRTGGTERNVAGPKGGIQGPRVRAKCADSIRKERSTRRHRDIWDIDAGDLGIVLVLIVIDAPHLIPRRR